MKKLERLLNRFDCAASRHESHRSGTTMFPYAREHRIHRRTFARWLRWALLEQQCHLAIIEPTGGKGGNGVNGDSTTQGSPSLISFLPGNTWNANAMIAAAAWGGNVPPSGYNSGTSVTIKPTNDAAVGFTNFSSAGPPASSYQLSSGSSLYNAAPDGKDMGAYNGTYNLSTVGAGCFKGSNDQPGGPTPPPAPAQRRRCSR